MTDFDALQRGIEVCDGVIHTAFNYELAQGGTEAWVQLQHKAEAARRTVWATGAALAVSSRPLVAHASGPAGRT